MSKRKTVKVRVPVLVSTEGEARAEYRSGLGDADNYADAESYFDDHEKFAAYWLTAELPIPVRQEVEAEVETFAFRSRGRKK